MRGLHLTPELLERAYEYLRHSPPFRGWNLPEPDLITFRVMGARDRFGHFRGRLIHLYQDETGSARGHHNPQFRALAARVCAIHGFDPENF